MEGRHGGLGDIEEPVGWTPSDVVPTTIKTSGPKSHNPPETQFLVKGVGRGTGSPAFLRRTSCSCPVPQSPSVVAVGVSSQEGRAEGTGPNLCRHRDCTGTIWVSMSTVSLRLGGWTGRLV